MEKKQNKKLWLILIPIVLVIAMIGIYFIAKPQPVKGSKTVTISVIDNEATKTDFTVSTDAEYLRQAMEETEGLTFSGDESEYGLMVTEVNGVVADYNVDGSYWAFYINDEYCQYGVDEQPVADGDAFKIEYTPSM